MTSSQLQEFAQFGAQARLQAIEEERRAIVEAFPDLGRSSGKTNGASSPATGGRKGMSPSQRKAVGERMRAYWAKRRGEKVGIASDTQSASEGTATPANQPSKRKGMSPSARKAQGERMRAYWAARRAEKGAGDGSTTSSRKGRKAGRKK
jgi:hypothetical protein